MRAPLVATALAGALIVSMTLLGPATPGRADCHRSSGLPPDWGQDPHAGMAQIEPGEFEFGSDRGYEDEGPVQARHLDRFWMDRTEVTNAQFASFVAATGYVTDAERSGGSAVFLVPGPDEEIREGSWWRLLKGANWRHPEGPDSDIGGLGNEPVVAVTYADAAAYAKWLGRSLPDEAQWEYAAKAGRNNKDADRSLRDSQGRPRANFWQGVFPLQNRAEDGYAGRAPSGCFAANDWGLQDMVGNVWEWTTSPYRGEHEHELPEAAEQPKREGHAAIGRLVIKGGSYLCADNYCVRARASSRQGQEVDLPTSHIGFRTISTQ